MTRQKGNKQRFNKENPFEPKSKLILYNDDVNTFEFVIESLCEVCEFEDTQAAQIALLAHYKGKTVLKEGERTVLGDIQDEREEMGITT